ncbi:SusC/RagA family TonB-linked outer membrane protein [Sunxiuqinia dokdonensis]|uniref:SusC/RagA family TonB-linked outer membrane protein n=1 Tax=Sunxiuqinia dokdonensis TaxID=1409788 RepID=A0A0L8VE09_9BACT|nr:SusC/RagA family TonB-linked outer membrane protein [Sunxiuqinia dokdonensis]KOH46676.1 susC/RagA family TonB-linked outer membrane protein [Sunxiuqinia dokdonensis]
MKKIALLLAIFAIGLQSVFAQTKEITGTVTSAEDGLSIPGVSVSVKGTTLGTITDLDGQYILKVPQDAATLVFSFVGMQTQEVPVVGTSINVVMEADVVGINEVVVTAMGIKRSEKTLGYAATTVASEELMKDRSTNVANSLSGKVAGVQIQSTSSDPGSATSMTIRGFGSINGSNQPLYVVDGVPLQNSSLNLDDPAIDKSGNALTTSGLSNISSNDIESMTILKGAAATALYGSRASNGVVVITTKQGSKGKGKNFTIQYNGGLQLRQISLLPEFQNEFGQGWDGTQTYIENGSWGPRLDGSTQVYGPIWNNQQLIHEYSARKNNVKDFFEIGVSTNQNISLSGVSEDDKVSYYVSFSNSDDDGIMPTNADSYKRNTLAFRSAYQGNDWFKISSSINFAKSETDMTSSYQGTSVIDGVYEMPRDISILDMQDLSSPFNTPEAYFTPYGITNPYWSLKNNYNHLESKQFYGKLQADIMPMEGLTLTYRFGFDYTDYDFKMGIPQIRLDDALINEDYGYAPSNMNQDGNVYARYRRAYEINHDFLGSYDTSFGDFTLTGIVGANINERYSTVMVGQTDVLTFETGFWDLSNGATRSVLSEAQSKRRLIGLFGDATFGYKEMLFLNMTARNDWSSTLPIGNNSYFYPGTTLSWIFSELMSDNKVLSFGKLRVAYGQTGNDADPYFTSNRFIQAYANGYYGSDIAAFPMNSTNSFISSNRAGATALKPEMTSESEAGLNLQFLNGRIGIDAAFYNRKTKDQIFTLPVDPSTGYSFTVTNFGEVQNKGVELLLSTTPVKTKNFRWDLDVNFAINRNKVLSMPESLDGGKVNIYSFSAGNDAVYMYAEEGQAMGTFYTYLPQYVTDESSEYYGYQIVDEAGQPVLGTDVEDTGLDMNHDWTGGLSTTLSAYGVSLSATLDVRYGGSMFSRTKNLMQFTGNSVVTTYNDRNPFVIPNSVLVTDDGSYLENTVQIKTTDDSFQKYFDTYGYGNGGLAYMVDRTFAKLRNVTLSYSLPKKWTNDLSLSDVSLSAFVNNAFVWTAEDNHFIDPESSTTGTDLEGSFGEMYVNPATRIFGFNLSITY